MGEHNFFLKSKTKLHLLWILKGKKNNEDQPSNGGMSESECSGGEWLRDGCITFRVVSLEMAWLQRQQFLFFHDFSAENFRQIFRINYVSPLCRDDSPGFLEMLRFRKWRSECKGKIPFQFWKNQDFIIIENSEPGKSAHLSSACWCSTVRLRFDCALGEESTAGRRGPDVGNSWKVDKQEKLIPSIWF